MSGVRQVVGMTGDEAVAHAAKLVNPDVVAAYPITPQTIIAERYSDFVNNGEVDTSFISVESEHSAMSACVGASLTGARVFTATASAGLALMYEILYVASGMRCPIVLAVANRAFSAPINIHGECTDQLVCRDASWVSLFGESAQEAYDETILSFKIAEHPDVMLPAMFGIEGFIVTHALERVETLSKQQVDDFIPASRIVRDRFCPDENKTFGSLVLQDYYMEIKRQQEEAMQNAYKVTEDAMQEFSELSGRKMEITEKYQLEDADYAFVSYGATAGNAKAVVDRLRAKGEKVGALKIRLFRPFPSMDMFQALSGIKAATILDRSATFGSPGTIVQTDIASALYGKENVPSLHGYINGLGGRVLTLPEIEEVYEMSKEYNNIGINSTTDWVGYRK
ncbi:MAG: pyruvate ferredoxin oxidoreductase [Candidatus Heimdallarchaeota archaeon]|nr:pyruvate ferredoxin oxidoreductase [Candidatus Heimdallarchaeota archaeon]MCG3254774.1 pyruvate ferredoxin oxidoreductase [Candidatus Heimdallarchaeota archaeon]MCK4609853.1 pyruvate ferredoxin oxidoreductase [Candidatus Heimdallarchaeota archaeon]